MRGRGQVHTLEAIVAALLLLTSVVFALQMTAVTPLSASTSSQHIENQQLASVEGVLASAEERDALKPAILFWNETEGAFNGTESLDYYTQKAPPNEFGDILDRQFGDQGLAYNVRIIHMTENGSDQSMWMVYSGEPSDNAVLSSRQVVLTDNESLYGKEGKRPGTTIRNSYIKDASSGNLYNVARVEVTVWRI